MADKRLNIGNFRGVDFASLDIDAHPSRGTRGSKNFYRTANGEFKKRPGFRQIVATLGDKINGLYMYEEDKGLLFTTKNAYKLTYTPGANGAAGTWSTSLVTRATGAFAPVYADGKLTNLADRKMPFIDTPARIYIPAGGYYCFVKSENKLYEIRDIVPTSVNDANDATSLESLYNAYVNLGVKIPTTSHIAEDNSKSALDAVNTITRLRRNKVTYSSQGASTLTLDGTIKKTTGESPVFLYKFQDYLDSADVYLTGPSGNATGKSISVGTTDSAHEYVSECFVLYYAEGENKLNPGDFIAATEYGLAGYSDRLFGTTGDNRVWFSEMEDYTYFPDNYFADNGKAGSIRGFLRLGDNTLAIFKAPQVGEPSVYYMGGKLSVEYDENGNILRQQPVFNISGGASTATAKNGFCAANLAGDNVFVADEGVFGVELMENIATDIRQTRLRSKLLGNSFRGSGDWSCCAYRDWLFCADGTGNVFVADTRQRWRQNDGEPYQYEWFYWDGIPAKGFCVVADDLWFWTADNRLCILPFDEELPHDVIYSQAQEGSGNFTMNEETSTIIVNQNSEFYQFLSSGNLENKRVVCDTDNMLMKRDTDNTLFFVPLPTDNTAFNLAMAFFCSDWTTNGDAYTQPEPGLITQYFIPKTDQYWGGSEISNVTNDVFENIYTNEESYYSRNAVIQQMIRTISPAAADDDMTLVTDIEAETHAARGGGSITFYKITYMSEQPFNGNDTVKILFYNRISAQGKMLEIVNFDDENKTFQVDFDGFHQVYSWDHTTTLQFLTTTPINAYWFTPTFNLGADDYRKTLTRLTVSTGDNGGGALTFGWRTDRTTAQITQRTFGALAPIDYNDLNNFFSTIDFSRWTLHEEDYSSHTIRAHDRGFIYIRFFFSSEGEGNCHVNAITATYKITGENRGVN